MQQLNNINVILGYHFIV